MAKVKTAFFCQNCGTEFPKWQGKCSACGEWNTLVEELKPAKADRRSNLWGKKEAQASKPVKLNEVRADQFERTILKDDELNRVLGGGLVAGSVILVAGEPGIGKSTLLLQLALEQSNMKVLYVSGEESRQQIRMRAERLGMDQSECFLQNDTQTQQIVRDAQEIEPELIIIDSIQTLYSERIESAPGTISQIRECAAELIRYAKDSGIPMFLIGHITKDGNIAGPKILEHMVDTVLQFEGDRNHVYRILRSVKNRFGSTNELGIYEMLGEGMKGVPNPSEILVSEGNESLSGVAVGCTVEGIRPLLIEIQALVSPAAYGTPQRSSTGFDLRRLNMLIAVLEKRCGVKLGTKDVFLNITGGLRVDDPATDLAVVAAILSSQADLPVRKKLCFAGEVGLSGEIRSAQRVDQRISEAEKLGYEAIIISRYSKGIPNDPLIKVIQCGKVEEMMKLIF